MGDNTLRYGEVGIPLKIACTLRREEKVTEANLEKIKNLVTNFPRYPCVVGRDGAMPHVGDIVVRMLMDGDTV